MNGRRPRPRIPTWALFAAVAGVLTASAVLFVASRESGPEQKPAASERSDTNSSSDDTLVIPKDGANTPTTGGRTDLGRRRPSDRRNGSPSSESTPTSTTPEPDQRLAALRGARIALVPADAPLAPPNVASTKQRIGTRSMRCGTKTAPSALARELEVLDALERALDAAGADVTRLDAQGKVACAGLRSTAYEASDLALVVATGAATASASAAVAGGTLTSADVDRATRYVAALEQATGAPAVAKPTGAAATALVAHGVVDMPNGGTVAWLGLQSAAATVDAERLATAITTALASTLDPAD